MSKYCHKEFHLECNWGRRLALDYNITFQNFKAAYSLGTLFLFYSTNYSTKIIMKNSFHSISKMFFLFSTYSNFCIFDFPSSSLTLTFSRGWLKINLIVYDTIHGLYLNFMIPFVWYLLKRYDAETLSIDRVLNKEHLHEKPMLKICIKS